MGAATHHGESLLWWRGGMSREAGGWVRLCPCWSARTKALPVPCLWCWCGGEGGGSMLKSVSGGAEACERLGSGGLGRPRWGVVAAGG